MCARSFVRLQHFLGDLILQRRQASGSDFISALLVNHPPDVLPLTDEEAVAVLVDMLLGGYKTVASLIGNGASLLLNVQDT